MNDRNVDGSVNTDAVALDTLARSLQSRLPRRRVAGLVAATLATGIFGIGTHSESVAAKRKRGKRSKRRAGHGNVAEAAATSIPPNCIYVCCDGTCDSWKMCLKCVKWPKPTTTTTLLAG